jgi:CheY-like chemotaxis protein
MKNRTVLLAEDDIDDQELLAEAFSQLDPQVKLLPFSTGKKIVTYLENIPREQAPDMIILDYNIPEMNGAEVLRSIRESAQWSSVVKLVWSTSNSSYYENSCLELGASAYLVKPSSIGSLMEMAKQMLTYLD